MYKLSILGFVVMIALCIIFPTFMAINLFFASACMILMPILVFRGDLVKTSTQLAVMIVLSGIYAGLGYTLWLGDARPTIAFWGLVSVVPPLGKTFCWAVTGIYDIPNLPEMPEVQEA